MVFYVMTFQELALTCSVIAVRTSTLELFYCVMTASNVGNQVRRPPSLVRTKLTQFIQGPFLKRHFAAVFRTLKVPVLAGRNKTQPFGRWPISSRTLLGRWSGLARLGLCLVQMLFRADSPAWPDLAHVSCRCFSGRASDAAARSLVSLQPGNKTVSAAVGLVGTATDRLRRHLAALSGAQLARSCRQLCLLTRGTRLRRR